MPISNAIGDHKNWRNNEKVVGFYARSAEVLYFPNQLERIFPNLRLIAIAMSKLKEVKQKSLMPFDQLQYLCFFDNEIEVIEKHLFAYNILLEAIDLRENNIVKINVNVFDYLINLRILYTSDAFNSTCVSTDSSDRESVIRLISEIKKNCNDRAILAKARKVINVIKIEEEKMLNLTSFVNFSAVTEGVKNATEKILIIEEITEIDEAENEVEDEFRASAVSGGNWSDLSGKLICLVILCIFCY